jgi:WD40 repeat protein
MRCVAIAPDGRLAASGRDRTVTIWDAATGSALQVFSDGAGRILSLVFSPDGRYLAATNGDQTASVWDLRSHPPARE